MHNFKELKVWQKAVDFAVKIYHVTKAFPNEEKFGLISQMRSLVFRYLQILPRDAQKLRVNHS